MSKTEQIIAPILDLLAARGWSIKPFEVEGEWSVLGGDASHEVLLVLQRTPVQNYLAGLVGSQVTPEMFDSFGVVAIEDEFANDAAERLHVLLSKRPGRADRSRDSQHRHRRGDLLCTRTTRGGRGIETRGEKALVAHREAIGREAC